MCHFQAVRHGLCGDFSQELVWACPAAEVAGGGHCHDRREDQGTRQEDTLCANCRGREEQRRRHGEADPTRSLLAEVRLKTAVRVAGAMRCSVATRKLRGMRATTRDNRAGTVTGPERGTQGKGSEKNTEENTEKGSEKNTEKEERSETTDQTSV